MRRPHSISARFAALHTGKGRAKAMAPARGVHRGCDPAVA